MNICNFCNKEFKTLSSLTFHKKTANYCIEIQKKENTNTNVVQVNSKHVCNYCNKEFTAKKSLVRHLDTCKVKQSQDNKNEEQKINDLKEQFEKMKEQYEQRIDVLKDENNKLKESVIEMKTEIRIKDEIIQRNDDQISELIKLTTYQR